MVFGAGAAALESVLRSLLRAREKRAEYAAPRSTYCTHLRPFSRTWLGLGFGLGLGLGLART